MMHGRRVLLAGACLGGLLLTGCVSSSGSNYGAAGGGYPAPGYAGQGQPGVTAPGYYGYPGGAGQGYGYPPADAPGYGYAGGAPPGQPYVGPDGLSYVDSVPVGVVEGEQVPFVFVGEQGGWGYYDRERRWRGAPPEMRERLERSHPGGRGLPPYADRQHFDRPDRGRPEARPFFGDRPGGPDRGGPGPGREGDRGQVERRALDRPVDRGPGPGFQPGGVRPEGGPDRFRPGSEPGRAGMGNAGRPGGEEQAGRREGMFGGPGGQGQGRPGLGGPGLGGPGLGGPRPGSQPQGSQGRPAAPPPRPAAPAPPRGCAPGQARC